MNIRDLCKQAECGHIEYKSEWYWDLNYKGTEHIDHIKHWGEFVKDFLALTNANLRSFDKTRFMIIGYDESLNNFSNFNLDDKNFQILKGKIEIKLHNFISDFESIDYSISYESVDGINIIIIKIEQPCRIHCLKKNIQTQTTDYKENTVLYRSISILDKDDSVGVMHTTNITKLEEKIKNKYGSKFIPIESNRIKSISNTISSYLEKNRTFKLSEGFPKKSKDAKGYFELYQLENTLDNDKSYFSYISDVNIRNSIESLHSEFIKIARQSEKIYLLVDKPKKTSPEQRVNYIKRIFERVFSAKVNIEFIEDFGKKHLYQEYLEPLAFQKNFPNTENFIENFSSKINDAKESILATKVLNKWFLEENHPLVVLTGPGGVGKTTVVRNFLNTQLRLVQRSTDHYVLFLDSSSLLEQLRSDRISTIYDLYKADISDAEYFTEELFKLSIDNGSFIIILDGLDEIISGASVKFKLQDFLKNIFDDYCFNLAKTKIIITCRDYIWEEAFRLISEDFNIEEINIKPFNRQQAEEFFKICFKGESKLQKKSMSLVDKLINKSNKSNEKYYSPFMLDVISDLVKSGTQSDDIKDVFEIDDTEAENLCLLKDNMLDYLIYAVCKREAKKINIDFISQIKILCKLSEINKTIDKIKFSLVVKEFIEDVNDINISVILNHPFLACLSDRTSIMIRFDFLKDYFLKVSVAQHFLNFDDLEPNILSLLVSKVSYLNNFSIEIGKRLTSLEKDNIQLFVLNNIERLRKDIKNSENQQAIQETHFYISNLFILYLGILKSHNSLNQYIDINNALHDIFSNKDGCLNGLCLCNIRDINSRPKLIFDFSDLTIDDCYIYNYYGFTDCDFNKNTLFNTGYISIESHDNIKSTLTPKNFSKNIVKLGSTSDFLDVIENNLISSNAHKNEKLKKFIKLFIRNGRFMPKKVAEVKNKRGGNDVKLMLSSGVIVDNQESKLNQDEYIINPSLEDDLYKFWDSEVTTPQIKNILNSM